MSWPLLFQTFNNIFVRQPIQHRTMVSGRRLGGRNFSIGCGQNQILTPLTEHKQGISFCFHNLY
jgi:hypothetical protein